MNESRSLPIVKTAIAVIFLITTIFVTYVFWDRSQSTEKLLLPDNTNSGVIASLDQNQQFSSSQQPADIVGGDSSVDTESQATQTTTESILSSLPYSLKIPDGWKLSDSIVEKDPCGGTLEWKTDTYKNETKKIIIHENGNPNACDGKKVADIYVDFDYNNNGGGIQVNDEKALVLCTKDDNPNCPKGDGVISAYIGNESDDGKQIVNSINGRTYFFEVSDSSLESDLQGQVRKMIDVIEKIEFK